MVYIVKAGMKRKDFEKLVKKATPTQKPKKRLNARKYATASRFSNLKNALVDVNDSDLRIEIRKC